MTIKKAMLYGWLLICLLMANCSSLVLDRVIVYPAYSFNKEHSWLIAPFKFKITEISGFDLNQLGNLGQQLTEKVKDKLSGAGIKVSVGPLEGNPVTDYVLKGNIVSLRVLKYEKTKTRYNRARKDRWGREGFEPTTEKMSTISVNGQIIQVSTDKMMAGFELYESTLLEGSPGVDVLLEEIANKIVDIVLGKRT